MRRFLAVGAISYLLPLTSYLFFSCGTAQKPVAQAAQTPVIKPLSEEQQRKYDQFFLDAILEREKDIPMQPSICCVIVWTSIQTPQRFTIS